MNNSSTVGNMNSINGGPLNNGAPIPMMNNGTMPHQQHAPHSGLGATLTGAIRSVPMADRSLLNKYIYDYFCRCNMWDCARALYNTDNSVGGKTENGKNSIALNNGALDDAMDTDCKDDIGQKQPDDLPASVISLTAASDSVFLYDWFCLFWDMWHAQRNKGGNGHIHQYVSHAQAQSRLKQAHQQDMLRHMRPDTSLNPISPYQMQQIQAMRLQNPGAIPMNMKPSGNLARTAMANNHNPQQTMQMMQAKHGQRDSADIESIRQRASSPSSENSASPSKRPRLEGPPFNPTQPMAMNGRSGQPLSGQPGSVGNTSVHAQALMTGMSPQGIPPAHIQNFVSTSQPGQAKSIQSYSQNLQQHHGSQMPNKSVVNPPIPQTQGSPEMITQAPQITAYYNAPGTMDTSGRIGPGGAGGVNPGGGNHALQDYQMQLMLLEQQNKKRLLMARQEQDNIVPLGRDTGNMNQGPMTGPNSNASTNGQFSDTSQLVRPGASPSTTTDQMKRGTPQMNNSNMPSPLPDSNPSRESPNPMPFNISGPLDPSTQSQQFNMMQINSMRAGSHPSQPMNNVIAPAQHTIMARQQQSQSSQQPQPSTQHTGQPPQSVGQNNSQWPQGQIQGQNQNVSNGPQMAAGVPPNQTQGTPQQRPMAPPLSATGGAGTSPALPARPPTPKGKRREGESKSGKNSKGSQIQKKSVTGGTRPANDTSGETEATPATPITPANPPHFPKSAAAPTTVVTGPDNSQSSVVAPPQHADSSQQGPSFGMDATNSLPVEFPVDFGNALSGNPMIEDFDFESFLHDDSGEPNTFDFNATFNTLEGGGEIGTTE